MTWGPDYTRWILNLFFMRRYIHGAPWDVVRPTRRTETEHGHCYDKGLSWPVDTYTGGIPGVCFKLWGHARRFGDTAICKKEKGVCVYAGAVFLHKTRVRLDFLVPLTTIDIIACVPPPTI